MNPAATQERKIKIALYAIILSIVAFYISQAAFIHLRLTLMDANKEVLQFQSESCDDANCTATWTMTPKYKLLLMGHIMRTHLLVKGSTNEQVFPISRVRGITADSWSGLRVYEVDPGSSYKLIATKPKAVKMGYFIGILPRTTDHEGVLSIPDISPTISTMTTMAGFGVLGVLLFAAFLAPQTGTNGKNKREELITIAVSAVAAAIVSAIGSGMVDSLLPDGELRSKILRICVITSLTIIQLSKISTILKINKAFGYVISVMLIAFTINYNWNYFRAGTEWVSIISVAILSLSVYLIKTKNLFAGVLVLLSLYDPISMMGFRVSDAPPIYLMHMLQVASLAIISVNLGSASVISMASKAYQKFSRDLILNQISKELEDVEKSNISSLSQSIIKTLPIIAKLTGAGRVSILINFPFARPITHSFMAKNNTIATHDDGKIPGAVTIRSFVYGDSFWLEKYSDYANRHNIAVNPNLKSATYFCVAPIRVSQNNMGVLMLTSFDDKLIEKTFKAGAIQHEIETGSLLVNSLSLSFSNVLMANMKETSVLSSSLLSEIRNLIPTSVSTLDFLQKYCHAVEKATAVRSMIHEKIDDKGFAICQSGFSKDEWDLFLHSPFNLSNNASTSIGSTVVAFKEKKSSYLKDWKEIESKLHPKTIGILEKINAKSFLAVPLTSGDQIYVITLISSKNEEPENSNIISIIESTEALFDAAVAVLNQKTSALALGKLANRLIGDDQIRTQIISAARSEELPTTIGEARNSFLLLFDLVGSSLFEGTSEQKARNYGKFYDELNYIIYENLGGKIRKTIGDAVIATWDGSEVKLDEIKDFTNLFLKTVAEANNSAIKIGCNGTRCVLHYGNYFFGLVGTSSFGQIDVIGFGIDEVCKKETEMKSLEVDGLKIQVLVSAAATLKLKSHLSDLKDQGFKQGAKNQNKFDTDKNIFKLFEKNSNIKDLDEKVLHENDDNNVA